MRTNPPADVPPVEMNRTFAILMNQIKQILRIGVTCTRCQQNNRFIAVLLQSKRTQWTFNADNTFFFDFRLGTKNHFRTYAVFTFTDMQLQKHLPGQEELAIE